MKVTARVDEYDDEGEDEGDEDDNKGEDNEGKKMDTTISVDVLR